MIYDYDLDLIFEYDELTEKEIALKYAELTDAYIVIEHAYIRKINNCYIPITLICAPMSDIVQLKEKPIHYKDIRKYLGKVVSDKNDYSDRPDAKILETVLGHRIFIKDKSLEYEFIDAIPIVFKNIKRRMAIIEFEA